MCFFYQRALCVYLGVNKEERVHKKIKLKKKQRSSREKEKESGVKEHVI